jgi:transcriptional regulator with XRE-family HTH domain
VRPRTPELGALGAAVQQARKRAGLSLDDLAERCNMYGTHISALERGVRNSTYDSLRKIAAALGTSVGELTTLADELYGGLPAESQIVTLVQTSG